MENIWSTKTRLDRYVAALLLISSWSIFLYPNTAFSDESVVLSKGEPAPFTGLLFTENAAKDIKKDLLDLEGLKQKEEIYKNNQELLKAQVALWKDQSENLSKQLTEEKSSFWSKAGFFLLGAGITTALAFAVNGATK